MRRFVVDLTADGHVDFRQHELDLTSDDPGQQDDAVQALQDALLVAATGSATSRDAGPVTAPPVLVFHAPRTPSRWLCWILHTVHGARPRVDDIRFVARRPATQPEGGTR